MSLLRKLNRRGHRVLKELRQHWHPAGCYHRVLLLLGCQKAGTSTLLNMLDYDHRTKVFRESSPLSGIGDRRLRLRPLSEVRQVLSQVKAPLIIAEPKIDSHRSKELLNGLPRSRVVWMLRNYRHWIEANLGRRTGQNLYLKVLLEQPGNWRAEGASDDIRALVQKYYRDDLSRPNCAALIWYYRNCLYFEQELDRDDRAQIVQYEELIQTPLDALLRIYQLVEMAASNGKAAHLVDGWSLAEPPDHNLDPAIEQKCIALQQRFCEHIKSGY